MVSKRAKVARALDVGYGFTKFTTSEVQDNGFIDVSVIPSYADGHVDALNIPGGLVRSHDLIKVVVGGTPFVVGPDAKKGASGYGSQLLEKSFFLSSQYQALCLGAMAMMKVHDHIDHLTVGLPLNVYSDASLHDHLRSILIGTHEVPVIGSQETKRVAVSSLSVVPQIIGSVVTLSDSAGGIEDVFEQRNLTIDVGYGTLLWMVSDGVTPIPARSGSSMGGVSALLQEVIKSMDPSATTNIGILDRLDQALLSGKPNIQINGKPYPVIDHRVAIDSVIRQNLATLTRSIGQFADIDNIFLSGGGAHLYLASVQEVFKGRNIAANPSSAQFANVKGFQILAENELHQD